MSYHDWNPFLVSAALFVLLVVAGEAAYRFTGCEKGAVGSARTVSDVALILGGVITLLALMLGFTFAMSEERYETRRQLVIDEANAIGTTYLRTWTLTDPESAQIRDLLRRYLALRVSVVDAPRMTKEGVRRFDAEATRLHRAMWVRAAAIARRNQSDVVALFLETLNSTIDLHAKRLAAFKNRVPLTVYVVLLLLSFVAMTLLGYYFRVRGVRTRFLTIMIALLLASVLWLIMDLDQPSGGAIRASQQSLVDLDAGLSREAKR